MELLKLAISSKLPMIRITTTDMLNIGQVLSHIAGCKVIPAKIPPTIEKEDALSFPNGATVVYTNMPCETPNRLYRACELTGRTVIFVNVDPNPIYFDAGVVIPPRDLVREVLASSVLAEGSPVSPDDILPAYSGMTLKEVREVSSMTECRDGSITVRGLNETRAGYTTLQGISHVQEGQTFYDPPEELKTWLDKNSKFFTTPTYPDLVPRGLLFDGPPGTGKTAGAKEIARVFNVPLYRLDIGAMKGKFVGDSEGNLLAALNQLDQVEPCVAILDEVEKVFQGTNDAGVTSSMLSQLLWWLQEHTSRVLVVMTTNDKGVLPKELYREGRLDDTLTFSGVSGEESGLKFASSLLDYCLATMGSPKLKSGYKKALANRVSMLYAGAMDSGPVTVTQSKLVKATKDVLREYIDL